MYELEIIGLGDRKVGEKNGKITDCVTVAFRYHDERMHGYNCGTCLVSGKYLDQGLNVGSYCNAVVMFKDYKPYIYCIIDIM